MSNQVNPRLESASLAVGSIPRDPVSFTGRFYRPGKFSQYWYHNGRCTGTPSTTRDCGFRVWHGGCSYGSRTEMAPQTTKPAGLRAHSQTALGYTQATHATVTQAANRKHGAMLHGNRREHQSPAIAVPSAPLGPRAVDYTFYRTPKGEIDLASPGEPRPAADALLLALGTADGLTLLFNGPVGLLSTHGERVEIEAVFSAMTGGAQ